MFEALRVPGFRNLWLGQAISQLGDALYYLVFIYMVDRITRSPEMTGAANALQAIPYLIFGLFAGALADRVSRRGIMVASDVSSSFLLILFAGYVWSVGTPAVGAILAAAFALNFVNVFFAPAKGAAIPALVPENLLLQANSLSMATQNFMPMIGIAFSAGVFALLEGAVGIERVFVTVVVINALSFLVSASFLRRLPPLMPDRTVETHPWADVKEGIAYIRRTRVVAVLLVLNVLMQLFIAPFFVAYIVVNREWFDGRYQTLATFELAFLVAMVVTSVVVAKLNLKRPGIAFVVGIAGTGVTVGMMAFSRDLFWFAFWNFMAGVALPFAQLPMNTYLQQIVPDAYRGRVNSVIAMASSGMLPIGALLAGTLISRIGLVNIFLIMGGGWLLTGLFGLLDRTFRNARLA